MKINSIQEFLTAYGRDQHIDIYEAVPAEDSKSGKSGVYPMKYTAACNIRKANIERRHDLYFTPNIIKVGCNRTIKNLEIYNALFIDMDAGRVDGKYLPLEKVVVKKLQFMEEIEAFEIKPTFIIETRNGYHIHWLLKDRENVTAKHWNIAMQKLIKKFHSDRNASDAARLMRLPFTFWQKKSEGLDPFEVVLRDANDVEASIDGVLNALKGIDVRDPLGVNNNKVSVLTTPSIVHPLTLFTTDNIKAIQSSNFEYFRDLFGFSEQVFDNDYEAVGYIIRNIDIAEYLGISNRQSFPCIFHDDKHPSAFISSPAENNNGIYLYTCRTGLNHDKGECDFGTGSIMQVTERLMKVSKTEARKFLYKCFNIRIVEAEWKQEQRELLMDNIMSLHTMEWEETAPDVLAAVRNYLPLLDYMHNEANLNLKAMKMSESGEAIFFFSQRRAAAFFGYASVSKINQRIAFLTFLKFIKKIPDAMVPIEWTDAAKRYSESKGYEESIQFYSITSYSEQHMRSVKERVELWRKHNGTMKAISRDYFLLTFGEAIADEVYPKTAGRTVAKATRQFKANFRQKVATLTGDKGWTTEKEALKLLKGYGYIKEVREKRVLDSTLQELGLKKVYLNKEMKEQFNINLPYGSRVIIQQ